jgi:hypothetical protein
MTKKALAAALVGAIGTFTATAASGYVYCGFLDRRFPMRAYHFNSEFWVDMVVAESNKWNRVHPVLSIDRTKSATIPLGSDGNSVIAWVSNATLQRVYNMSWPGALAVTVTWYEKVECGRVVEQDLLFNPAITLFTQQTNVPYDLGFQEIALHELGHVVTLDHEDRGLAVMTSNDAVSNVLYNHDKVGWIRSAAQKFNPLPGQINDMGVFPLRGAPGTKIYSTLSPKSVARGANVTINDFTVQNLSSVFPFSNPVFRVVLEDTGSGASTEIGTFFWSSSFSPFSSWAGNLNYTVPASIAPGKYRVAALLKGTDDDNTNNRADFGTITVF